MYISDPNLDSDALMLHTTHISLVNSILEYSQQIYSSTFNFNFSKLDRSQRSTGRITTGLRHSIPDENVLFKTDLLPLSGRR